MAQYGWDKVPMERIDYEYGANEDRFVLLVVTKRYGGDPVSPLYERQARRLMKEQQDAGFFTRLVRLRSTGEQVIEADF
jgi:hypothetical protein